MFLDTTALTSKTCSSVDVVSASSQEFSCTQSIPFYFTEFGLSTVFSQPSASKTWFQQIRSLLPQIFSRRLFFTHASFVYQNSLSVSSSLLLTQTRIPELIEPSPCSETTCEGRQLLPNCVPRLQPPRLKFARFRCKLQIFTASLAAADSSPTTDH